MLSSSVPVPILTCACSYVSLSCTCSYARLIYSSPFLASYVPVPVPLQASLVPVLVLTYNLLCYPVILFLFLLTSPVPVLTSPVPELLITLPVTVPIYTY